MRLDWFAARLARMDADALPDDAVERLTEDAELFLRAQGALSWVEWRGLSDKSREIFADAGDRIRAEHAGMVGAACAEPEIAQAMMTGGDLNDAAARRYCAAGLKALEAKLAQEVSG